MNREKLREYAIKLLLRETTQNQWVALSYLTEEALPDNDHRRRGILKRLTTRKSGKKHSLIYNDPCYAIGSGHPEIGFGEIKDWNQVKTMEVKNEKI